MEVVEEQLLGGPPDLTRLQVCERADVPVVVAEQLWRLLGFPHVEDDVVAFTEADVAALRLASDLVDLGILGADSQAALVRTWGRSFARLAEWQADLFAELTGDAAAPDAPQRLASVGEAVLPRLEQLQSYAWRRHLAAAAGRVLSDDGAATGVSQAVCFVDIVGYTTRSKELDQSGLVDWLEGFEARASSVALDHGGRVIKTIGDEVLLVADTARAAADVGWELTRLGEDPDEAFPQVRAGVACGEVVARLGDVFGPTVNVAARLTSHARPGSVLVDRGAHDVLCPEHGSDPGPWRLKRLARTSVKGYARLESWVLREQRG